MNVLFITNFFSLISTFSVIVSFLLYSKSQSRLVELVVCLITSYFFFSFTSIIWQIIVYFTTDQEKLSLYCRICHPFFIYFLIAGFGWSSLIALRFRNIRIQSHVRFNFPYISRQSVWAISLIYIFPMVVLNTFESGLC